jgi:heterodisulfide reductase subunit A
MDMRTHGKGFEECYNDARARHGIRFQQSRVHSILPLPEGGLRLVYADAEGSLHEESFDLAVLSVGMEIPEDVVDLARKLNIQLTPGGFAKTASFSPVETSQKGIYVCGAFQGPKDIPQTVIEAGSAAMMAGSTVWQARGTETVSYTPPAELNVTGDRPRVGVFVCHCGTNIGGVIDVPAVRDYARNLPYVEYAADNLYTCSQDTQDIMTRVIQENDLNRIVVAACTPKTHEPLFQETLVKAGLNKYLFEMVNIRNHGSWVHREEPVNATKKAEDLVRMAVAKVALCEPLEEETLEIDPNALVIGGGVSGMAAARSLADQGYPVHLVERGSQLGGQARSLFRTAQGEDVQAQLDALIQDVLSHKNIQVHLDSTLTRVDGFVGNFESTLTHEGAEETVRHGVTVIATGAEEHRPGEYLYGEESRVVTALELDRKILSGELDPSRLSTVAFIQCVGSREPERPYCSRVCCTHTLVSALHMKQVNPEMTVVVFYRDIRTYGEREYLFQEAREKGVIFLRYDRDHKPEVVSGEKGLILRAVDPLLGRPVEIRADLLTLASAVVPPKDEQLARFFKIPMDENGFFVEAHVKLAPFEFATDGVFLCGMAHYPKPIDESIAQAQAAASRAVTLLARKTIATSGNVAYITPSACSGCGVCVSLCPYNASDFITEGPFTGKAEINPVLCKGCGLCVASCRSGAINLRGFESGQIMAMIHEM